MRARIQPGSVVGLTSLAMARLVDLTCFVSSGFANRTPSPVRQTSRRIWPCFLCPIPVPATSPALAACPLSGGDSWRIRFFLSTKAWTNWKILEGRPAGQQTLRKFIHNRGRPMPKRPVRRSPPVRVVPSASRHMIGLEEDDRLPSHSRHPIV